MPKTTPRISSPFALILVCVGFVGGVNAQNPLPTGGSASDEDRAAEAEALEADATLFPIPSYSGDIATRAALTGDWGGTRTTLAERGIQFSADVNQYYQGILDGGIDTGWDYSGSSDYRLKVDTQKAGFWQGGFLELHGESYWGQSINNFTGAALAVNADNVMSLPAGNGTYLPHVVFTQFLSERFAVFGGKLDTTVGDANRFAHGVGDQRFMNLGLSFNAVSLKTAPYSTLGAGFLLVPAEDVTFSFTALDTDGTISDAGFDTVFNGNTTYSGELILDTDFLSKPGRHTFGLSASTKDYLSTDQDPRVLVSALDAPVTVEDGSWAFAYNFDQYLVTDANDPSQGWGLFGRFGVSDGEANILHRFYSLGLGGTGIIPGRDRDRFGAGYYYLQLADDRPGLFTDGDEHGLEVFYNLSITPAFELSADLQVIDGAGRFSDNAVIGGLRARITF